MCLVHYESSCWNKNWKASSAQEVNGAKLCDLKNIKATTCNSFEIRAPLISRHLFLFLLTIHQLKINTWGGGPEGQFCVTSCPECYVTIFLIYITHTEIVQTWFPGHWALIVYVSKRNDQVFQILFGLHVVFLFLCVPVSGLGLVNELPCRNVIERYMILYDAMARFLEILWIASILITVNNMLFILKEKWGEGQGDNIHRKSEGKSSLDTAFWLFLKRTILSSAGWRKLEEIQEYSTSWFKFIHSTKGCVWLRSMCCGDNQ